MTSINARAKKDDILAYARTQSQTVDELRQQSRILWAALGLSLVWQLLF